MRQHGLTTEGRGADESRHHARARCPGSPRRVARAPVASRAGNPGSVVGDAAVGLQEHEQHVAAGKRIETECSGGDGGSVRATRLLESASTMRVDLLAVGAADRYREARHRGHAVVVLLPRESRPAAARRQRRNPDAAARVAAEQAVDLLQRPAGNVKYSSARTSTHRPRRSPRPARRRPPARTSPPPTPVGGRPSRD